MKAHKNVERRVTILLCDPEKDVAHEQHTGFDKLKLEGCPMV